MKLSISGKATFIALGVAALFCATPARAQVNSMVVDVPFAFVAGDQNLPAGMYRVTVDQDFRRLLFVGMNDTTVKMARLSPATDSRPSKTWERGTLRFTHYGELYILSNVWRAGQGEGNRVEVSKRLLEAATRNASEASAVNIATPN